MSAAWEYYAITLLVYFGSNAIACWSLNLQYGVTGIMNFAFILFQAAGAYTAAVLTLGPSTLGSFQHYFGGASLPWPLPLLGAIVVGCLLALVVGIVALRPERRDYQAVLMLVMSIIATAVVSTQTGLVNGSEGLAAIPKPFAGVLTFSFLGYGWFYVGLTAGVTALTYLFVHRITASPWGRRLRALRDNPAAAAAMGTNVLRERLLMYVIGGGLAALSGGVLVQFISAWSPASWTYPETFLVFTAIIIGGLGNDFGAAFGAAVVLGGLLESVRYLPTFGYSGLAESVQWIILGFLVVGFLWFRPQGLVPERRRRLALAGRSTGGAVVPPGAEGSGTVAPAIATPRRPQPAEAESVQLAVHELTRDFGGIRAVDRVSFVVPRGQITALIGPNGAGKSTVLTLIAGELRPTAGRIIFRGRDISGEPVHRVAGQGIIRTFQLSSEFARLTVLENLLAGTPNRRGTSFWTALAGKRYWGPSQDELITRAHVLLDRFGLTGLQHEYAGELSGGQRRMVEIMRAMMAEPRLLLLDEPFAGVSPGLSSSVEDQLVALRNDGLTILIVEHEMGAVERLSDSVIAMSLGRILARGSLAELRQNKEVLDAYLVG